MMFDGVPVVPLARTKAPKYRLEFRFADGQRVRGSTAAWGRWSHLLVRRERNKGSLRLYVIRRGESETGIRNQIRRETAPIGSHSKSDLVVFEIAPEEGQ